MSRFVKISVDDDFEKGQCYDCQFAYDDTEKLGEVHCIFHSGYWECPLEIKEDWEDEQ